MRGVALGGNTSEEHQIVAGGEVRVGGTLVAVELPIGGTRSLADDKNIDLALGDYG